MTSQGTLQASVTVTFSKDAEPITQTASEARASVPMRAMGTVGAPRVWLGGAVHAGFREFRLRGTHRILQLGGSRGTAKVVALRDRAMSSKLAGSPAAGQQLIGDPVPPLLEQVSRSLAAMERLRDGWSGAGSIAPSSEAVGAMRSVLRSLDFAGAAIDRLAATADGGVVAYALSRRKIDGGASAAFVEIAADLSGETVWTLGVRDAGQSTVHELGDDLGPLLDAITVRVRGQD